VASAAVTVPEAFAVEKRIGFVAAVETGGGKGFARLAGINESTVGQDGWRYKMKRKAPPEVRRGRCEFAYDRGCSTLRLRPSPIGGAGERDARWYLHPLVHLPVAIEFCRLSLDCAHIARRDLRLRLLSARKLAWRAMAHIMAFGVSSMPLPPA